jgi:hypothetical protein
MLSCNLANPTLPPMQPFITTLRMAETDDRIYYSYENRNEANSPFRGSVVCGEI